MNNNYNYPSLLIAAVLILVGSVFAKDTIDLRNSYSETFEYIMSPLDAITDNPLTFMQSFKTFDEEVYMETAMQKTILSTFEAFQYRLGLPLAITCIIGGLGALLYRERVDEFLYNSFRYLI